jgi:hypothetical protein
MKTTMNYRCHPLAVYRKSTDSSKVWITDVSVLQHGEEYFVDECSDDHISIDPKMSDFYNLLGSILGSSEQSQRQIMQVKQSFQDQAICFDVLVDTGDLAISDSDLKEYGISKGGLRKAILLAIGKLQKVKAT